MFNSVIIPYVLWFQKSDSRNLEKQIKLYTVKAEDNMGSYRKRLSSPERNNYKQVN